MDWDWGKFCGEKTNLGENKENPTTFCDSIGSNNEEPTVMGWSEESSSKRSRLANENQACLVDGCDSDLSNCKEYHRRHRVCDSHSKTPVVLIRGEEKRFCQQCSRFHSLGEFDEVKRSCRKRLDGHNRRRRKPQPESLFITSTEFLSNCKGPIVLRFSDQQIDVPDEHEVGRSLWPMRTEMKASMEGVYGGENKQLPFYMHNNAKNEVKQMVSSHLCFHQQLPDTISQGIEVATHKTAPTHNSLENSGCALYLLSSHPVQALPDAGLSSLVQTQEESELSSLSGFSSSFGSKDNMPVCKTNFHPTDLVLEMEDESHALFQTQVPNKFPISWD